MKILGMTISNTLSVSHHITNVVNLCAHCADHTLRAHGMSNATLHIVYRSVIVAKLLYAASARYGFSTADDRQRLEAVIRRGISSGLCPTDQLTVTELVDSADESLCTQTPYNHHVYYTNCFLSGVTAVMICEPGATTENSPRRTTGLSESL